MPEQETYNHTSDFPMPLTSRVTVLGNYIINLFLMAPAIVCPAHLGPLKQQAASAGIQAAMDAAHDFIQRVTRTSLSDWELERQLLHESYRDEFTLYTKENIQNCNQLLMKRARQFVS